MPRLPLCTRSASTLLILSLASTWLGSCADTSVFVFDQEVIPGPDKPYQGVVRFGTASALTQWDPMVPAGWHIASSLQHGSLLRRDPHTGAFIGELASSFWHDENRSQLYIEMGQGIFHDGSPVTVEDVLHSFKRAQESTSRGSLQAVALWLGPQALSAVGEGRLQLSLPPGEYSLELALAGLARLPIVPLNGSAIGAGPYRLEAFDHESALLVAVSNGVSPGGQVAEILIFGALSSESRRHRLTSGQLDLAVLPGAAWPTPSERRQFTTAIQQGTRLLVGTRSDGPREATDAIAIGEAFGGRLRRMDLVPARDSENWLEPLSWPDPKRFSGHQEELQLALDALGSLKLLSVPARGAEDWAESALAWADIPAVGIPEQWVQIVRGLHAETLQALHMELERHLSQSLQLQSYGHQIEWLALAREGVGGLGRVHAHLQKLDGSSQGLDELKLGILLR